MRSRDITGVAGVTRVDLVLHRNSTPLLDQALQDLSLGGVMVSSRDLGGNMSRLEENLVHYHVLCQHTRGPNRSPRPMLGGGQRSRVMGD